MVDTPKNMEEALVTITSLVDEIREEITCRQKFEKQKDEAEKRAEEAEKRVEGAEASFRQMKEANEDHVALLQQNHEKLEEYEGRINSLVNENNQLNAKLLSAESSYNALVSFGAMQSVAKISQQTIDPAAIAQPFIDKYAAEAMSVISDKDKEIQNLNTILQHAVAENNEWRRQARCVQSSLGFQALAIEQQVPMHQYLSDIGAKDGQIARLENELRETEREKKEWKTKAENLQADWDTMYTRLKDKNREWEHQCELAEQKQKDFKNEQWLRMEIERENSRLHREIADLHTQKKQNQSSESHHGIESQPGGGPVTSTDEETPFQQGLRLRTCNEEIKALQATIVAKDKKISHLETLQHGWEFGKNELVRQKRELRERLDEVLKSPTIPSKKPTAPGFFTTMFMCVGMGLLSMAGERGYLW